MKKYLLWVAAAIAAEILIMVTATVAGLSGTTLIIAITILPAGLFAAAIYLAVKSFRGGSAEDRNKGEDAEK